MSRRCPKCKNVYEGEARFCPKDGSPLVDVGGGGAAKVVAGGSRTVARTVVTPPKGADMTRAGSLTNQLLDRRYQIVRRLGEGGMSYVYQARDKHSGELLAIKVLSPKLSKDTSSVERLRREAGLAMRLDHPHVCPILRFGETEDGLIYLVMPYLRGELLSDREARVGPMAPEMGIEYLAQICSGLHHAHQLHIVHRDLKPENVMLVPEEGGGEVAVVMDFGLAKEKRADPAVAKLTATGIILGTPEFMSPEQIRGKEIDARSDVYALGILAFEMFTGNLPFQGRSPQEMMIARLRGKPTPVRHFRPEFPAELETALMKSLETDPADRYPTALDLGRALVDSIDGQDVERLRELLQ